MLRGKKEEKINQWYLCSGMRRLDVKVGHVRKYGYAGDNVGYVVACIVYIGD